MSRERRKIRASPPPFAAPWLFTLTRYNFGLVPGTVVAVGSITFSAKRLLAGTMGFFYFLCLVMGGWSFYQSYVMGNKGFDPFPYAFLFFVLGGIMQSLFVPTMLTAEALRGMAGARNVTLAGPDHARASSTPAPSPETRSARRPL